MSDTEELFDYLEYGGFRLSVINRRLVVAPDSELTPALRLAIEGHNDGLVSLVDDDPYSPAFRKRRGDSMQRADNQRQLLLFVERDQCANKRPPFRCEV